MTGPTAEYLCILYRQYGDRLWSFDLKWVDDDHFHDLVERYVNTKTELLDWIAWDDKRKGYGP